MPHGCLRQAIFATIRLYKILFPFLKDAKNVHVEEPFLANSHGQLTKKRNFHHEEHEEHEEVRRITLRSPCLALHSLHALHALHGVIRMRFKNSQPISATTADPSEWFIEQ